MNYCYCSLLTSDNYLKGVLGLAYSLKIVDSKYPFLVIITDNISEESIDILKENNISFIIKPLLLFQSHSEYVTTINKFYLYTLINFEKIIFIDADAFVLENIDKYFNYNMSVGYRYWNGHQFIISGGFLVLKPSLEKFQKAKKFIEDHP